MTFKQILHASCAIVISATTATAQVPSYVPTDGLVGWWPFNGNANDESGNGNNGTVNGATLTSDRNGNVGKAYSFDGVDDYIQTLVSSNNSYAISVWLNPYTLANMHIIGNDDEAMAGKALILNSFGGLEIYNCVPSPSPVCYCVPGCNFIQNYIFPNSWSHVVISVSIGVVNFYHNGTLIASGSGIGTYGINWQIGAKGNLFTQAPFNGKLDDIGIWNRALTQQEITGLYNAQSNCANNTTIAPQINALITGNTAVFTANTSDPNPSFVWQSDFGQGFQTLNNFGNYTGANSGTLSIANVQLSEHNQPIRVITTAGSCIDTSNVASVAITDTCINTITDTTLITVTDTLIINTNLTGLNPPNNLNTIKVFPNPANDHITINYGNFSIMTGYELKIQNSLGQQVFQTSIIQQTDYLNLATWGGNGLYFVHIIDPQGNTIDIRKIVLQ
jgi:hypothetical protein